MNAEVRQAHLVRQIIPGERTCRFGYQSLAAVGYTFQPGNSIDDRTVVIPVLLLRGPGVQRHADLDLTDGLRPDRVA